MRYLQALLSIALLGLTAAGQAAETPLFSFGAIADCQYCDQDGARCQYRLSPAKLEKCVEHLNTVDLSFVVHLGDFIDRESDRILEIPRERQAKAGLPAACCGH